MSCRLVVRIAKKHWKHCLGLDIAVGSREDAHLVLGPAVCGVGIMKSLPDSLQGSSPLKGLQVLGGARRDVVQERGFGKLFLYLGHRRVVVRKLG